mmetsp:Transcript_127332/g.254370  ORF Transcript_127332/g.254370 Transcript_127332/m.254370 type:complete len:410 (+) Transcript_127332:111-1340(+)
MDYFAVGGRPLLSGFPPFLSNNIGPKLREISQSYNAEAEASSAHQTADHFDHGNAFPSSSTTAEPITDSAMCVDEAVPKASWGRKAPVALHTAFEPKTVSRWEPGRFEMVRKLQDATRNRGQVHLMSDNSSGRLVAVKQMPNRWIRRSHSDFVIEHPSETEMPWQDVGCVNFLNGMDFPYVCSLLGVYRDDVHTYVVTSFATEGDLFSWCESGCAPGVEREVLVQPLARQMMAALQQLHEFSIVHRDLSLENILLSKLDDGSLRIQVIDFSMASTSRRFSNCVRGKASYQAPELHTDKEHDAYLSDIFALGVTLYAVLTKDYPWLSTRPGGCKCFDYARKHGFRAYLVKRKLRNTNLVVADVVSEPLKQLLEGMLAFDPNQRLTLGEAVWPAWRRSVWDEPWMHEVPGK